MTDINYIVASRVGKKDYWEVAYDFKHARHIYNKMCNSKKRTYDSITIAAVVTSTDYQSHPMLSSLKKAFTEEKQIKKFLVTGKVVKSVSISVEADSNKQAREIAANHSKPMLEWFENSDLCHEEITGVIGDD